MNIDFSAAVRTEAQNVPPVPQPVVAASSQPAIPEVLAPQITMQQGNPFDIEAVKRGLAVYEHAIVQMQGFLNNLEVTDAKSAELAVELGTTAKKAINSLEKVRKGVIESPYSFVRTVNNLAKYYKEQLQPIEKEAKRKYSAYQAELERQRLEVERLEAKKAQAKQATTDEVVTTVATPEAPKATHAKTGTASTRNKWQFEITDPTQIPVEYLMVDEKKIRQAVKDGVREIAGVRIFEEKTAVFRTK